MIATRASARQANLLFPELPQEVLLTIFKLANFTSRQVALLGLSSRAYWEMTKRSDQVWSYFLRVDFVFYTQVKENQYTSDASFISKEKIEIITKQHETCYMSKLHSIHSLPENVLENIKSFVDVYGVPYSVINREIIQISPDLYEPLPKWIIKWSETKTLSREDYDNGMKELFEQFDCKASDFQDELIKLYESLPKTVLDKGVSYHVYRLIDYVANRSTPLGSTTIDVQVFPVKDVIKFVRRYYRCLSILSRNKQITADSIQIANRKSRDRAVYVMVVASLLVALFLWVYPSSKKT